MNKKFQVFVSSTYRDLTEERQEVMQALLELDCIPVGMELFPAADDDQWTLIKRLIDDCDYYILIIGGRYGSINENGISYTQMEYEYALSQDIPIISFLHKKPSDISVSKSEEKLELKEKLEEFRNLAEKKLCRYWESHIELGSQVSRSLVKLIKDKPRPGWVKADLLPSEELTRDLLDLKNENENLKKQLISSQTIAPSGTEDFSSGNDLYSFKYNFIGRGESWDIERASYEGVIELSWDQIFAEISPLLIDETTEDNLRAKINSVIKTLQYEKVAKQLKKDKRYPDSFSINDSDFQTIKIQFRALNYMTESLKKRSIHDKKKYWTLTPYGDNVMTRLRAIKK
ncbi:DUF4062 domain-containing protein [Empedobacter brevis]|uniref:DUF4062 domain-containing protein n=1 Tax=Empedobacter brevis TaxID=247 RepID=UPI0028D81046|nr:DUF4062 domain-containing protein [Empedobacter brevis]